ncbi:MAG: serine/threonine-protein kinase, partial [Verrucomicrobiota bacterium]
MTRLDRPPVFLVYFWASFETMPSADETPPTAPEAIPGMFVAPSVPELQGALPQFEILELLGQGGMGAVYKAKQPRLNRNIAIKLLPPLIGPDEYNYAERFELEAQSMARLNHPNIVTVHDFGETEGGLRFIVMEYVDGTDLHHLIHGSQLTKEHVMSWLPQICSALQYAHENGLVHRDIKPANILISSKGEAKVVDFGLAKLADPTLRQKADAQLTSPDVAMGTPEYTAPETFQDGAEIDSRADIYSLGVLFYEMLTGQVPRGVWRPPSEVGTDVDPRFDPIIAHAMQADRNQRYQNVAEISQALVDIHRAPASAAAGGAKKLAMGGPTIVKKRPAAAKQPIPAQKSGMPLGAWIGIGAALVGVIAAFVIMSGGDDGENNRDIGKGKDKKKSSDPIAQSPKSKGQQTTPSVPPGPPDNQTASVQPDPPPSSTVSPPPPPKPPVVNDSGEWIDALADVNVDASTVSGDWRMDGDSLIVAKHQGGADKPRFEVGPSISGSYELEVAFNRAEGGTGNVILALPIEEEIFAPLHLSGFFGKSMGINQLNRKGTNSPDNPTAQNREIESGRQYWAKVKVFRNGPETRIAFKLDDEEIFDWTGPTQQLPKRDGFGWTPRDPQKVTLGA